MLGEKFSNLLKHWEFDYVHQSHLVKEPLALEAEDVVRLKALAEAFGISKDEVAAGLMNQALNTLEEQMPYVPGSKVIRVEEGEEIFEDIGPMPRYRAAIKRLTAGE
ncbi:MAG: hypothetical protein ACI9V8_000865 [Urechidicola sp.]|jgi:hypothetical protein